MHINGHNFKKIGKQNKRILVTGGVGFIGSNLVEKLLADKNEVIVMDNMYSSDKINMKGFLNHENFEFVRHDVTFPFNIEVDEIYHLACPASPIYYQKDPVYTIKTSFYGALNVLENAKRTGAKVLLASTSEVYGNPVIHPQNEQYWGNVNPNGPRSCYDEGKRAAETLFCDYYREYGVSIRIARIFNTFGPKMGINDGRVVSNFIMQALSGEPITLYGGGEQTRSFCFVSDIVEALQRLMARDVFDGPVNMGNPVEISIRGLAEIIREKTGCVCEFVEMPLPTDDPLRRRPDIGKAIKCLGWQPEVDLTEGIERTIDYFREKYAGFDKFK